MSHGTLFIPAPRLLLVRNRAAFLAQVLGSVHEGHRDIVLGFGATEYVDSSGLNTLVALNKMLVKERGGQLRLSRVNDELMCLFKATGLATTLELVDGVHGEPEIWGLVAEPH